MGEALSVPFAAAAVVLCVAGVAKLRAPATASAALASLGAPTSPVAVRVLGVLELGCGCWCLIPPGRVPAACAAVAYATFAVLAWLLARRHESCGCFGESELPASLAQSLLSAALSATCALAALSSPLSLQWILARPATIAASLVIALAGCAYALIAAYTLLPEALAAWSAR